MTRREIIRAVPATAPALRAEAFLALPVRHVFDSRAKPNPEVFRSFSLELWPETVRNFEQGGIRFQTSQGPGEVRRAPSGRPVFEGLHRGVINLVLTDYIPMQWDHGRGLGGVTTVYEGYHVCLIALRYAHGNQIPFVSVNTCVHELLHVLLLDIFEKRPKGVPGRGRELRIDWHATRLWLFGGSDLLRNSAASYLERLKALPRE